MEHTFEGEDMTGNCMRAITKSKREKGVLTSERYYPTLDIKALKRLCFCVWETEGQRDRGTENK
jgi:hypothetical protein